MNGSKTSAFVLLLGLVSAIGMHAQAPQALQQNRLAVPRGKRQLHVPPQAQQVRSSIYRYLTSDEGRAWMQAADHPMSTYLNQRFGPPSSAALEHARTVLEQMAAQSPASGTESLAGPVPCTGAAGARFNLEPRVNAAPQFEPSADFILNGAGPGSDLIVQVANDGRVGLPGWDGSVSGYYVHTSKTGDCSVQFEGGLPNFGGTLSIGQEVIAADSVRRAFFIADNRINDGAALFRASADDLLNPAKCPNGTHNQKQAESCWMQTPPVIIDPGYLDNIELGLTVDERSTGKGAGDVYVTGGGDSVFIVACTNSSLTCSPMASVDQGDNFNYPSVQVRTDGTITISYMEKASPQSYDELVKFVTCKPAGAPKSPVCGTPTTVATASNGVAVGNQRINFTVPTGFFVYSQHANRTESNGAFTTFIVYDECTNGYVPPPPPSNPPKYCLGMDVKLTFSTDNAKTWSAPVSVDTHSGFHLFPTITSDASTGNVFVAHYSTEGDYFENLIRVFVNRIAPGTTVVGPAQSVTTMTPNDLTFFGSSAGFDLYMGAVAHGNGITGPGHLYLSFDSEAVNGTYNGVPLPDLNNHILLFSF